MPIRSVLFDVNETLSDMSTLRRRFELIGAPGSLAAIWFAGVLRDGFALTAAGAYADFRDVADAGLRGLLTALPGWDGDIDHAAAHILDGFAELAVHPDVPEGVRALHGAGLRLAALTNGSATNAEDLLARAGLGEYFAALLDVRVPRAWKPAPAAYRYALDALGTDPAETVLIAVHPWDVDGARRAGLQAAWLNRDGAAYPSVMTAPTHAARDLRRLAHDLTAANG
jgi:2-haloacid dehalogenase